MSDERPVQMLVLASYFKGERFMQQAHARGARVWLLTVERLLGKPWPRGSLVDVFAQGDESTREQTIRTVSYLARSLRFDRIVALDDFDVETAAALREHLRLPGMGDTTARYFRDKLAMRVRARDEGIPVPDFVHVLNHDALREFMQRVPAPWMFKPRGEASATGIIKIETEEQLWRTLDSKGDDQSFYLLERYLPGDVFHVDSVVADYEVVFQECHRCGKPPFNVAHGGGIFTTSTVERGSADDQELVRLNMAVLETFGLRRGVSHVEFIKSREDGKFYFLEGAARVGGAHIADVVEASSGLNLWQEWANLEVDDEQRPYHPPKVYEDYAGVAITLARQEHPDLSGYNDPEIVLRPAEEHHAGLVIRSKDHARVQSLLESYQERFLQDFCASLPAPARSAH